MRISDWSSDVCSSDLPVGLGVHRHDLVAARCGDQRGDGEVGGAGEDESHGRGDWGLGIGDAGKAEARKSARGATRLYRITNPEFRIPVVPQLPILIQRPIPPERLKVAVNLIAVELVARMLDALTEGSSGVNKCDGKCRTG